jgi:hypothetical protein
MRDRVLSGRGVARTVTCVMLHNTSVLHVLRYTRTQACSANNIPLTSPTTAQWVAMRQTEGNNVSSAAA